jgi:superfamily II DNA or RNA helicase
VANVSEATLFALGRAIGPLGRARSRRNSRSGNEGQLALLHYAAPMEDLVEAIRRQCSPQVWQRAVQLAQTATVSGKRTHNAEIEVRVITRGGMASPLVCLAPAELDWSCECESNDDACVHVAASALWVREAMARGEEIPGLHAPMAKIAYRLRREEGWLRLERFFKRGDLLVPLQVRLTQLQRRGAEDELGVSQADITADLALSGIISGKIPRPLMARVLAALTECDDVQLEDVPIRIGEPRPVICAQVDDHADGFQLKAVQDPAISELFENGAVLHGGVLRPIGELELSNRDVEELRKGKLYDFGKVADLVGRVLPALAERLPVSVRSQILPSAIAMPPRLLLRADFDGDALQVLPLIVYGDPPCARVDAGKLHYLGGALPLRNEVKEQRLIQELDLRLGLRVGHTDRFVGLKAVDTADKLRAFENLSVEGTGLDACFVAAPLEPELRLDGERFELAFNSHAGDQVRRASAEAVLRAYRAGDALVPLVDGGWAALPSGFLERCGHLVADLVAAKNERGELPAAAAPDLARLCEALNHPPPPSFGRLRALIEGFDSIPAADLPEDLTAILRPYQALGVNWLAFLSNANLGAMLADDMGLGKTLQALCVVKSPCLVIAPAGVLYNWQREIARFRPALSVNLYHGANRGLDDGADVTLTSYATLRNDIETIGARHWDTLVLDEAQNIKNAESQAARAAFELQARFRITLTGTPVENRLDELWSQFHFLNPGLLGGRQDFQERYARPISEGDSRAVDRLRGRLRPFLMRRLKREVARDLPPRTEVVLRCILGDRERELYDAIRAATQRDVLERLQAGGNVLAALEALLRLRQACCHPSLLPGQHAEQSSKLELLLRTLEEAVAEGHKALVFSQWTSLLDLAEPVLQRAGLPFCRLDGSTRDRAAVVDQFQDPNGPPLMLISLKAGGTGLNLTAADHVFLLDPWWNPAVEDQAADRAHRIGQDRPVLVQRLVAADTVEERMLELQDKKRLLASAATGDARGGGGITRDDLLALLS